MDELTFQSIADLPQVAEVGEGDYLLTVSGGEGKLLPAANFSGGSEGSCTLLELVYGDPVTVRLPDGSPLTAQAYQEMLLAGPVMFYTGTGAATLYMPPIYSTIYQDNTGGEIVLQLDTQTIKVMIGG